MDASALTIPQSSRGLVILSRGRRVDGIDHTTLAVHRLAAARFASFVIDVNDGEDPLMGENEQVLRISLQILDLVRDLRAHSDTSQLTIGGFFSGLSSAAAMTAAATDPTTFGALVTFNGRPDLAGIRLHRVETPVLFLVNSRDEDVFEQNRWAERRLSGVTRIDRVNTTDDGRKSDELAQALIHAEGWFALYLSRAPKKRRSLFSAAAKPPPSATLR